MSYKSSWDSGNWNTICDSCGRQFKASMLRQRWDGLMVCDGDWEPRQPQDFVRGMADKQAPPWARPEQSDDFIFSCTPFTSNGMADVGVADCARADINDPTTYIYQQFSNTKVYYPSPMFPETLFNAVADFAVASYAVADVPYTSIDLLTTI